LPFYCLLGEKNKKYISKPSDIGYRKSGEEIQDLRSFEPLSAKFWDYIFLLCNSMVKISFSRVNAHHTIKPRMFTLPLENITLATPKCVCFIIKALNVTKSSYKTA